MSKAQNFWDKQAKRYENGERQFDNVYKEIIAKTKAYLSVEDNVLDFGCATGRKAFELASSVGHIHGLDFSTEMINEAEKKRVDANISNCSFSQGTIFKDELKNASFDKIISYSVIHLLEDGEKVIRRINDLLKPGGLFISTTACLKDKMILKTRLQFSANILIKKIGLLPLHLNMYKFPDVENLIRNQGFVLEKSEKIFHGMTIGFIVARKQ